MPKSFDSEYEDIKKEYVIEIEGQPLTIEESQKENTGYKFRMLRIYTGMNRKDFAEWLHIPYHTMTEWERGTKQMPEYLFELIAYKVMNEKGKGNI